MAGVQVDPGSRVEEVRKCMNQLHTISGLHAIPVTSVVSPSHTQWAGEMPTQGYHYLGVCPNQVSIQLEVRFS